MIRVILSVSDGVFYMINCGNNLMNDSESYGM